MNYMTNPQYIIPDRRDAAVPSNVLMFVCRGAFSTSSNQIRFSITKFPFSATVSTVKDFVNMDDGEISALQPFVDVNPLNFEVKSEAHVIIRILGPMWRLSETLKPHFTTKRDYGDAHWGLHWFDTNGNPIFDESMRKNEIFGFYTTGITTVGDAHQCSFNTDLVYGRDEVLPVSIDPDIQNKGGALLE